MYRQGNHIPVRKRNPHPVNNSLFIVGTQRRLIGRIRIIIFPHTNGIGTGVDQDHFKTREVAIVNNRGQLAVSASADVIADIALTIGKPVVKIETTLSAIAQGEYALIIIQAQNIHPDIGEFGTVQ